AWSALDSLEVVFLVWRTLASQSRCALCWLVVGSGEVLSEFFLVGSGGSKVPQNCVVLNNCCCPGEGCSQDCSALVSAAVVLPQVLRCAVGLAVSFLMVRVGWSFGLCILVKVLPRIALCRFWWRDELSLSPVGLSVLQSVSALSVKALCAWPCTLSVPVARVVCFVLAPHVLLQMVVC
ncbi:hypothetical protein Taro_009708, partial [Colocasia esculenta]|nr:hypothetical protein [Colocasia esculenta]